MFSDTIAAISTPIGNGGIGIVRLSGGDSVSILKKIFVGKKSFDNIKSHTINYGVVMDVKKNIVIDEVLVSVMFAPNTYTREDVIEINCHGGVVSVRKILQAVLDNGARLAEQGEFTKRAFLNGRIDLAEAEAVIDIINAKTDLSQEYGIKQLEGKLSSKVNDLRDEIIAMIANIEASIDYPEHEMERLNIETISANSKKIIEEIKKLVKSSDTGKVIKNGVDTVILGKPNVGKSSLLNSLMHEERAIVTNIPGTTRDVLTETISIDGIPINLIDTAGIRETSDEIEKIGVSKSKEYATRADLILFVFDSNEDISDEEIKLLKEMEDKKIIVIINKIDLESKINLEKINFIDEKNILKLSVKDNIGINALFDTIKNMFFDNEIKLSNDVIVTSVRHKNLLNNAQKSLESVLNTIEMGLTEDFVSIDLQETYGSLGEITGETLEEDIIDRIFSDFCLGK